MSEADISMLCIGLVAGGIGGGIGGCLAGLAGIGGGLIYVPVFYACLPHDAAGISLSVFLSLLAIVFTGGFSAQNHYRLGHLDRPAAGRLLPGLIFGASLGLMLTLRLPEATVLAGLALLNTWLAWDYGRPIKNHRGMPSLWLASVPVGYLSGILGIGGGTMLVPLLRRSLPLRKAVGTSALCGTLMAAAALTVNGLLISDWSHLLARNFWFACGAISAILLVLPYATGWSAKRHVLLGEKEIRVLLRGLFATLAVALALSTLRQLVV